MKNVLLVGAGNLGRRHLQGLKGGQQSTRLIVVEPYPEARTLAEQMYEATKVEVDSKPISFCTDLAEVADKVDVAVLATPANGRLQLLGETLAKGATDIVLEKVAFNSVADIDAASDLMARYGARGWVNCPRRLNPVYTALKDELADKKINEFKVVGDNFGMACNAIHFLDLFAFLSGIDQYQIDLGGVESIEPSKRGGYIEFYGKAEGTFDQGPEFQIKCGKSEAGVTFKIAISLDDREYLIDEIGGSIETRYKSGEIESRGFRQPYQSELTGALIDTIIQERQCGLTTFDESMALHRPFISAAHALYISAFPDNQEKMVPIT
ncbi:Gfo/Idh/MocA family oxidoreductase [Metapseudomonas furukawaii]|uniref:Gfo/Idh/MocA family oxidoreductase n=1 Tax=Metapseudomonas furukawaii TaxID=1149133 RepID=UPI0040457A33